MHAYHSRAAYPKALVSVQMGSMSCSCEGVTAALCCMRALEFVERVRLHPMLASTNPLVAVAAAETVVDVVVAEVVAGALLFFLRFLKQGKSPPSLPLKYWFAGKVFVFFLVAVAVAGAGAGAGASCGNSNDTWWFPAASPPGTRRSGGLMDRLAPKPPRRKDGRA